MGCLTSKNNKENIESEMLYYIVNRLMIRQEKQKLLELYKKNTGEDLQRNPIPDFLSPEEQIKWEDSIVLKTLIPGLSVDTYNEREILLPNGMQGMSFQLASFRNGVQIPFSCESNGIRSIFSVLSLIVAAYNNPSVCIAIDEFDAGVFEHLLGTIVKVYAESGKGLFIFTSHNLRPLEILRRNNIFFTTKEHYLFDTSRYIPKDFNKAESSTFFTEEKILSNSFSRICALNS